MARLAGIKGLVPICHHTYLHPHSTRFMSACSRRQNSHSKEIEPKHSVKDVVSVFLCLGTPPAPANLASIDTTFRLALFQRRHDRPVYPGKWGVITGKFEQIYQGDGSPARKETADEATARELYEETGFRLPSSSQQGAARAPTLAELSSTSDRLRVRTLVRSQPYEIHDDSLNVTWRIWPRMVEVVSHAGQETGATLCGSADSVTVGSATARPGVLESFARLQEAINDANEAMKLDESELVRVEWVRPSQIEQFDTVDGLQAAAEFLIAQYHGNSLLVQEQRRVLQTNGRE